MTSGRFADFDEAFAEQTPNPLVIKLYGQDWILPGEMPASVPLKMIRYAAERGPGDSLSDTEVDELAAELVPSEVLDVWRTKGLKPERLDSIVRWIVSQLMARDRGEPGEASAPSASSSGGGSSKPTSHASTDSTFPAPSTA